MSALGNYLVTPEALRALHDYAAQATDGDEQSRVDGYVTDALEISGLTWDAFVASTPAEQDRIAADAATPTTP